MATNADLKSMIMSFRVAELQSLLKYAGEEYIRLRKKELQKKALKLMTKKRLSKKIKSIYKNMMGNSSDDDNFVPSSLEDCYDDYKDYFNENSFSDYDYLNSCSNSYSDNYYQHSRAEDQYFAMFTKNLDMKRLGNVKFKNLTFFEHKSDLLMVTPMIPKKQEDDLFLFEKTFTIDSEANTALFSEGSQYQALLRFCVLNNEMLVDDQAPSMISVRVNHDICTLPPVLSVGSKRLAKRYAPVDITSSLGKKNKYVNALSIEWPVDYYTLYGVVVHLMKKYTSDELITKLKAKGERDASISKKFIYDSLNDDDDNEISATTLKMSLICPIGKMPIKLPTRSTTCNHLQCFDGCSYIQINELKSTWICPVCSQTCLYEDLFVDGYFTEILRSDKFLPDIRDVELDPDGSWRPVMQKEKTKRPSRNLTTVAEDIPELKVEASVTNKNDAIESDGNIINDLKDFFYEYNNSDVVHQSDISLETASGVSDLSELPINLSNRTSEENSSQNESLANNSKSDSPKKEVLLVDLTMSDSETDDDIKSVLSSASFASWNTKYDLNLNSPLGTMSPPVYDIDSDSSF